MRLLCTPRAQPGEGLKTARGKVVWPIPRRGCLRCGGGRGRGSAGERRSAVLSWRAAPRDGSNTPRCLPKEGASCAAGSPLWRRAVGAPVVQPPAAAAAPPRADAAVEAPARSGLLRQRLLLRVSSVVGREVETSAALATGAAGMRRAQAHRRRLLLTPLHSHHVRSSRLPRARAGQHMASGEQQRARRAAAGRQSGSRSTRSV